MPKSAVRLPVHLAKNVAMTGDNQRSQSSWVVHKFGGSSLADADHYRRVARILITRQESTQAVVVSAMGGSTDLLLQLVELASGKQPYADVLTDLQEQQQGAMAVLLPDAQPDGLQADFSDIADILHGVSLVGHADDQVYDLISGFGELWSAQLLAGYLQKEGVSAQFIDARSCIFVSKGEMGPAVNWPTSQQQLEATLAASDSACLVITGFIASTNDGQMTTLGRNGSDYSAAIIGRLLAAESIHIWTDVDGVMSADPRLVPDARVLQSLSFDEALELAYFGASVIHPQTMTPIIEADIPLYIRNTFRPDLAGTRIDNRSDSRFEIKGISATYGMSLINLEGAGMIGVPGTARRVFGALKRSGISVVMISQASSEHSICFVVHQPDAQAARASLLEEFEDELRGGKIQSVQKTDGCTVLAVVGDAMAGQPGIAARFFTALSSAGINVRAIAQGSSERNISAVIDTDHAERSIRTVHAAFYLSPQTFSIGLVGIGKVGAAFLSQLAGELDRLKKENNLDLRVRAIANSRQMLLSTHGIDLSCWETLLASDAQALNLQLLEEHVHADHLPHSVMIDCTADETVAGLHSQWLAAGINVVTPNKKGNAAGLDEYQSIRAAMRAGGSRYLYEATVGAGLPVIKTLQDLCATGDRVEMIEGIFSGTLAYLFNLFDGSQQFSELVRGAWQRGYTEPDPRDDLSGMDVARKLVILGREMGLELELDDLHIEGLVPAELEQGDVESFLSGLAMHDQSMRDRHATAAARGCVLRYTGSLSRDGVGRVALVELPVDHAFAHANLTDNIVQFATGRYCDNPLVVQGPGAGLEVTAAGIFADLLRLCGEMGARL